MSSVPPRASPTTTEQKLTTRLWSTSKSRCLRNGSCSVELTRYYASYLTRRVLSFDTTGGCFSGLMRQKLSSGEAMHALGQNVKRSSRAAWKAIFRGYAGVHASRSRVATGRSPDSESYIERQCSQCCRWLLQCSQL